MKNKYKRSSYWLSGALSLILLFGTGVQAQVTMHYWSFNSGENSELDATTNQPTNIPADLGTGVINHTLSFSSFTGASVNLEEGFEAGQDWAIEGTANIGENFEIAISTKDNENIILSFAARRSSTGYDNNTIEVSSDGGVTWSTVTSGLIIASSYALYEYNLTSVDPDVENNENVVVRMTFNVDAATGAGNNRYDNIKVSGNPIMEGPPEVHASDLNAADVFGRRATLGWTNGDGVNRIVVMREGSAVDTDPVDGTAYLANKNAGQATFGWGDEIGTGNFVVYQGTGTSVKVQGLNPGAEYYFSVFEYNVVGEQEMYLTNSAPSQNFTTNAVAEFNTGFDAGSFEDWYVFSVSSSATWTVRTNGGAEGTDGYVLGNNFGADAPGNDWLISPAVDLTEIGNPLLEFFIWTRFSDEIFGLDAKVSSDYSGVGDPTAATWTSLDLESAGTPAEQVWVSREFSLTDFADAQNAYIAFVYTSTGTGGGATKNWRVDEISLADLAEPFLSANPTSLQDFVYEEGEGPSEPQSFNLTGENLVNETDSIEISVIGDYEFSMDAGATFGSDPVMLGQVNGGISETIYVRLIAGLSAGAYNGEIQISGGGADPVAVSLSGHVTLPILFGDVLVRYPILDDDQLQAFTVEYVAATDLAISDGDIVFGSFQATSWQGPLPYAQGNEGWAAENASDAKYFSFNVSTDAGYVVMIDSIRFEERATGAGPSAFTVFANEIEIETQDVPDSQTRLHTIVIGQEFGSVEFRFAGWDNESRLTSGTGQWRVNDFTVFGTLESGSSVEIAGTEGWRMLSVPAAATLELLAGQNQVQGIPGVAAFYGTDAPHGIETAAPNVYTAYQSGWHAPDHLSDLLMPGKGLIWYLYDNDYGVSKSLPFHLTTPGFPPDSDVSVDLHAETQTLDDGEGGFKVAAFNLLGNPFQSDLDITEIASWAVDGALNSEIVQVWQNDEEGAVKGGGHSGNWVLVGGGNNDNLLAAWQGFMLENENATGLVIPLMAQTETRDAEFYKQQKRERKMERVEFTLDGRNEQAGIQTRDRVRLAFSEKARECWDLLDATKLAPLADNYATLSFVGEKDGQRVLKAQESRPFDFEGSFELPVSFDTKNMGGEFTITWDGLANLPDAWQFTLVDNLTGSRVNLRNVDEYTFTWHPEDDGVAKEAVEAELAVPEITVLQSKKGAIDHFNLIVTGEPVSSEITADVPKEFYLSQNYPNPFNPATVISYTIPEQAHIRLAVFDMLGRQLEVLVDEQQAPGTYDVTWDATDFSSGMYLYRIEADGKTQTRRMTLVK